MFVSTFLIVIDNAFNVIIIFLYFIHICSITCVVLFVFFVLCGQFSGVLLRVVEGYCNSRA